VEAKKRQDAALSSMMQTVSTGDPNDDIMKKLMAIKAKNPNVDLTEPMAALQTRSTLSEKQSAKVKEEKRRTGLAKALEERYGQDNPDILMAITGLNNGSLDPSQALAMVKDAVGNSRRNDKDSEPKGKDRFINTPDGLFDTVTQTYKPSPEPKKPNDKAYLRNVSTASLEDPEVLSNLMASALREGDTAVFKTLRDQRDLLTGPKNGVSFKDTTEEADAATGGSFSSHRNLYDLAKQLETLTVKEGTAGASAL